MAKPKAKRSLEEMARRATVDRILARKTLTMGAWMLATIMRVATTVPAGIAYAMAADNIPNGLCIPPTNILANPTSHGFWATLVSLTVILLIYSAVSVLQGKFILWAFQPTYRLRVFFDLAPPPSPPPTPAV